MLKPISEIMGAQLVDFKSRQNLGEVTNWVINAEAKQISTFLVKPHAWFGRSLAVATSDIVEYGHHMLVVREKSALVAPDTLPRLPKLIRSRHHIIGSPVVTTSGKKLGLVEDILFETIDATIQKIYVHPGILSMMHRPDIIIGADKIISIEPKRIVVQDNNLAWKQVQDAVPEPATNQI